MNYLAYREETGICPQCFGMANPVDAEDTECYCYKLQLHFCNDIFCPPPNADVTMEYLLNIALIYAADGAPPTVDSKILSPLPIPLAHAISEHCLDVAATDIALPSEGETHLGELYYRHSDLWNAGRKAVYTAWAQLASDLLVWTTRTDKALSQWDTPHVWTYLEVDQPKQTAQRMESILVPAMNALHEFIAETEGIDNRPLL